MKKNLLLIGTLLVGMTMATGCSNEDSFEQNQGTLAVVKATIDNGSNARTSVNELYQVVWSADDAFTVFGDNKKGDMTLQGQGGATTGDFQGTLSSELADGDVALFPAVGDVATMTYTFNSEYTSTETDAPLYGTYNGNSFTFSPLSAVIRVNASGLTAGTQYVLTITSTGNQALTGEATLGDNNVLVPSGDGKTITVKLTSAADVPFLTFDAPIPAQTYTGLTISLKAEDADATTLKTLENFTAVAGKLYEATEKVTSAQELKTALAKGGNVDIDASITLTEDLEVTENTILDLNNQTLTTGDKTITVAEGKMLTIQNAASLTRSASGPSIIGSGDIITASNNSTIIIGEGVNLTSTNYCCVFVPNGVSGVTITTAGNLTSQGDYAAIQANGNATNVTVNVIGGSISSACEGIYFPCTTNLNISGGTITGTTAVYHKSGNLTISGGALKATGAKADYVHNGNGCNATGDALVIEACDYPGGVPFVSITGGEFVSENAKAIGYYQQSTEYKLENENFITGGKFHDVSVFNYLADNANINVELAKNIVVGDNENITIPVGATVSLDLNGHTISQAKVQTTAYAMITNKGTLTILDTATGGKISYEDTGNGGEYVSNAISNQGVLTLESGTIENTSSETVMNNGYPHAIDVYQGSTTNIKGGTVKSVNYDCIRMFCNSTTLATTVNISGGNIINRVTFQNPSSNNAGYGELNITGGTFTSTTVKANVRLLNFSTDVSKMKAVISGGTFDKGVGISNYGNWTKDWSWLTIGENVSIQKIE